MMVVKGREVFFFELSHFPFWEITTLLIIISCRMVNIMFYLYLDILGTWRLIPKCFSLLLSALYALLSSTLLEGVSLSSS